MKKSNDIRAISKILGNKLADYQNLTSSDSALSRDSLDSRGNALKTAREVYEAIGSVIRNCDAVLSQDMKNYHCQCYEANNILSILEISLNKMDGERFTTFTHKNSGLTILAPESVIGLVEKKIKSNNQAAIPLMLSMKKADAVIFGLETTHIYEKENNTQRREFEGIPVDSLMNSYTKDETGAIKTSPLIYFEGPKSEYIHVIINQIISYSMEHGIRVNLSSFEEHQARVKEQK